MTTLWLAVSITIFLNDNLDGTPQIQTVPQAYYQTEEACDAWRRDRYENKWGSVDPVTNKIVDEYLFDCVPQTGAVVQKMLENPLD
ncbi:hypothetical protein PXK56_18410 [Phaeobacter gallaeciensis]|uniref:hypothetical protein n=1 Tax=Phaeobacter gallaeciensis TaxID=60890 RepID=UPI002380363C|nr:hypothetical protein [Phaeobacter gallaeciensis]MDE4297161.1 hypothetical protein [Phaeobacter gallaeciensis]